MGSAVLTVGLSYEDIQASTTEEVEDDPNAMELDQEPESEGVLAKDRETPQPWMQLQPRKTAK